MAKCKNCRNLVHKESDFRFPWCPIFDDCFDIEAERECPKFERMSNADKIRSMSDEELAEFFNGKIWCQMCGYGDNGICYSVKRDCHGGILKWLKSEVKEKV